MTPRARRSEVLGYEGETLRIKLNAPPIDGAANQRLIEFLAEKFDVAKKNIKILHGEKSRIKEVEILGLSDWEAVAAVLRPHKS